jgi:predicted short-subunit dehydrogenase-like oxidoreductase (DUF2520 family)
LKPTIAIVGYGNVGRALHGALKKRGYKVKEIIRRDSKPKLTADVVWFCVPDKEIVNAARALAPKAQWSGKVAIHSSGALPASELNVLKKRGASIASAHPMNTFVAKSKADFTDVPFAIEGDTRATRVAETIARDLNGNGAVFRIDAEGKPLYHAMGGFGSPLLIALLANAEVIGKAAGVKEPRRALATILRKTIDNYIQNGAAASFSGPMVRGDAKTIRKHLVALKKLPQQRDVYLALARSATVLLPSKIKKI